MGMSLPPDDERDVFSRFYAVVLNHWAGSGRRVRWSRRHGAWLRSRDYGRYHPDPWLDEPGETHGRSDAPAEDDQAAATTLACSIANPDSQSYFCQRCWRSSPESHYIAPDIYGDSALYCLQVPAYDVVDSFGGTGQLKHWGSPFGCQSVDQYIDSGGLGRGPYLGPLAVYVFGQPLPADEVINRAWCSRCTGFATNVRHNAARRGEDEEEWARREIRSRVRQLLRKLAEYYGDE
jgi:hypothetical protein